MQKNIDNKARQQANIFKIPLNSRQKEGVLRDIYSFILKKRNNKAKGELIIFTPNPEIILLSLKDAQLTNILKNADINIVDGLGLSQGLKYLSLPKTDSRLIKYPLYFTQGVWVGLVSLIDKKWLEKDTPIIKGREIMMDLIKLGNKKGLRIALLGDQYKSALKAKSVLESGFSSVKLMAFEGPWLDNDAKALNDNEKIVENDVIDKIGKFKPDVLFVGFGAPKQEKWVNKRKVKLNSSVIVCVGRSFEWVSGISPKAPKLISDLGFEWLYRLLTRSSNIKRIVNAVIVFPWRVFCYKLHN